MENRKCELPCGAIVERYRIIGTTTMVYRAYRPSALMGGHSSLMSHGGRYYGAVGSERLPPALDALPAMTAERRAAVDRWHGDRYREAYALIEQAFAETVGAGRRSMGEIALEV